MSDVRMVRGEEHSGKLTIFLNSAMTCRAVCVFENPSVRDIVVSDVNGRIVKRLHGITAGNVVLDDLKNGLHTI